MRVARLVAAAFAVLGALVPMAALADGEAGIVIQIGDEVQTHCVAFDGESITGDEALRAAGHTFEQFGGATRTLCAIDDVGCFDPSSYRSCFCECPGGPDCTYWAFFERPYGSDRWTYSPKAFHDAELRDGDMHAYKWGEGGPNSAPAPIEITFEEVCGHAPGQASDAPAGAPSTATVNIDRAVNDEDSGTNTEPLIAFGAVAAVLVAATVGAVAWRRRHGR